jgi:aminoglycoside 3-N-acetyltransferase
MSALGRDEIAAGLRSLGVDAGGVVFLHSSLSSMGHVDGGAETVVDAFLDVLGPGGTLAVPAFTLGRDLEHGPILDPAGDESDTGRTTEAVRLRPGAKRSHHILHSVAALGADADMTDHHGPSAWAADGPFWRLHELDGSILLLGVPYLRCTYFHMLEQIVQVPYRRWVEFEARLQEPDGLLWPLLTRCFVPEKGFVGNDFNKLGAEMERRGLVKVGAIGNAVGRLFRARDAVLTAVELYRDDTELFIRDGGRITPLDDGVMVGELDNEKSVLDPNAIYQG